MLGWALSCLGISSLGELSGQFRQVEKADYSAVVILGRYGFEPKSLSLPPGKNRISVYNRSGLPEIDLRIRRLSASGAALETLAQRKAPPPERAWSETLSLTTGKYEVFEAAHPEWTLALTIRPDALTKGK